MQQYCCNMHLERGEQEEELGVAELLVPSRCSVLTSSRAPKVTTLKKRFA